MPVVQLRQEGVAAPYLCGAQGLGPPNPKVVTEGGQVLQAGEPRAQGASGEEAVEGGGHRGCSRVSGGSACGMLAGAESEDSRRGGGWGAVSEGEEGGPGPP